MIKSSFTDELIILNGSPKQLCIEFMSIFDELYNQLDGEYREVLLSFIVDKCDGNFDKEYPRNE